MSTRQNKIFISIVIGLYLASIVLSFLKIYVYQAYPIYYSEDEIPGFNEQIQNAINFQFK